MKIVLVKPKIHNYLDKKRDIKDLDYRWDNADGIACTGFYRLFKDLDIDFKWVKCKNDNLSDDEINEFSKNTSEALENSDLLIRVGSPAWFNKTDIVIYESCIQQNIPFSLFSIGTGCKWDKYEWHIFKAKSEQLQQIIESDQLKLIICRDPNCYSLISRFVPQRVIMNQCLGFHCLDQDLRKNKNKILIEILDVFTLRNNGLFSEEEIHFYFSEMKKIINFFEQEGCKVDLMFQRNVFDDLELKEDMPLIEIDNLNKDNKFFWLKYFPGKTANFAPCYQKFFQLFGDHDVLISGRVHGILPAAGNGMACFGLGIDQRQFTCSLIPTIKRKDIRRMTSFFKDVVDWWKKLKIEDLSLFQSEIRSNSAYVYLEEFDKLFEQKIRNKKIKLHPKYFYEKYKLEERNEKINVDKYNAINKILKRKEKMSSNKFELINALEKIEEKFDASIEEDKKSTGGVFVVFSIDEFEEEMVSFYLKEVLQKYKFAFLIISPASSKPLSWWDEFFSKSKQFLTNAEMSSELREAMGDEFENSLSRCFHVRRAEK